MLKIITMHVNGEEKQVAFEEGEPLVDTLRNQLGLKSVKKGCEVGECGACTVLIDGRATNSCIYLTAWAENRKIVTVEGIHSDNGCLHPVQQAFIDEGAIQCGFCTTGLVLTAVEIANSDARYTREELRKQISGHICRCTGYENILNAVEKIMGGKSHNG